MRVAGAEGPFSTLHPNQRVAPCCGPVRQQRRWQLKQASRTAAADEVGFEVDRPGEGPGSAP